MPSTGANTKVKDPEYCNWLKVSLALYYLKAGLSSFIQDEVEAMHKFILQKHTTVPAPLCSSCNAKDVKQNRKNGYSWGFKSPCPISLCDIWLKELLALCTNPTSSKLYCENCDVTAWPKSPWECAKFYMPRGQTVHNTGPAQSDSQALLTLMANCKHFHSKLSPGGMQLTHTVSTIRNKVMHSEDMRLSNNDGASFITDIIKLLKDPSHLKSLDERSKTVVEINKINTGSLEVFFNTDMEMEMKALSECVKDLRHELGVHMVETEKTVESLKEEYNNLLMQMNEMKDQLCQHENRIRTLEEGRDSQTSGATADVRDIQLLFIKAYKGVQIISVNAVLDNAVHWKDLEDFYTDIVIEEEESTQRIKNEQQLKKAVTSFRQIFEKYDRKVTRIILQAPAGQGKSTFCRKVVHTWCSVQNKRLNNPIDDGTSDRSETSGLKHEDEMLRFDVLLYICLRDISDAKTLMHVVHAQFPLVETQGHMSHIEALIGQAENNKVLLIMDGLDEMDISLSFIGKIMRRELYPNLTVLATTRSWKIGELRLIRLAHFDLLLDVQGFSFDNSMLFAKKLFDNYYNDESAIAQFQVDILKNNVIRSLIHVPLLLLFIVQVWYERKSFPQTIHELYLEMLDVIVNRYMKGKKRIEKNQGKQDQKWPLESTTFNANLKLRKLSLVKHFGADFLAALCEVANHFLINACRETSLVFDEEVLLELLGKEEISKLQTALDLGILSKSESRSTFCEKIHVTFLHKTVQEFLAAINICCKEDRCNIFLDSLKTFDDVFQNEQIIKFAAGISTTHCQKIYEKIYEVCEKGRIKDNDILYHYKMQSLTRICIDCVREARKETLSLKLYCIYAANQEIWNELQSALKNTLKVRIHLKYLRLESCILNDAEFEFFEFQCLTKLKLEHVTVKGKPLLSKCTELKDLELFFCTLDDDILDLSDSICLEDLSLKYVTTKGKLMLSKCTELKCLKVNDCTLDDDVLDLSKFICLKDLGLKNVTMKGKLLLSKCTELKHLKVNDCTLDDDVLDLSEFICLKDLGLINVTMKGKLLLSKCTELKHLKVNDCTLDDDVLDLSEFICLKDLRLINVTMKGKLLLSKCTELMRLIVNDCTLDGYVLDLSDSICLYDLSLKNGTMKGKLLLSKCTELMRLDLSNCSLDDDVLDLSVFIYLYDLSLKNVTMKGKLLLSKCTDLKHLKVNDCTLDDYVLDLSDSICLEVLSLKNVTMKGKLLLSKCTELRRLDLSNCTLDGYVLDLSDSICLYDLSLKNVTMKGKLLLSKCTELMRLDLSNCTLDDDVLDLSEFICLKDLGLKNVTMKGKLLLSKCTELKRLKVNDCTLDDDVLDLSDSICLYDLSLKNVTMKGKLLLSKCTELMHLDLSNCTLDNDVLDLSDSICLYDIRLTNVTMKGKLLLSKCTELKRLNLSNCTLDDVALDLSESTCVECFVCNRVTLTGRDRLQCTRVKQLILVNCNLGEVTVDMSTCPIKLIPQLQNTSMEIADLNDVLLSQDNVDNCIQFTLKNVTMSKECKEVICKSLSQCKKLESLSIKNMDLFDALLSLDSVNCFHELKLDNVIMSKECSKRFCNSLSQCKELNRLSIRNMDLYDALLSLVSVNYVYLENVTMSKECKEMFCNSLFQCKKLERLSIKNLDWCDALLNFSSWNYLRELTLDNVTMSKECKVFYNSLSQCKKIKKLSIKNVDLCDGLHELHNMKKLNDITLEGVKMGTSDKVLICESLCQCTQLMNLTLKNLDLGDGLLSLNNLRKLSFLTIDNVTMCEDGYLMLCRSISTCKHLTLSLKNLDLGDAILSLGNVKEFELVNITMSLECVDYIKPSKQCQLSTRFKSIEMIANSCDKCGVNYTCKIDCDDLDDYDADDLDDDLYDDDVDG